MMEATNTSNNLGGTNTNAAIAAINKYLSNIVLSVEDVRKQLDQLTNQSNLSGDLILPDESNKSRNTQVTHGLPQNDLEKVSSPTDNYFVYNDHESIPEEVPTECEDFANNEKLDASLLLSDKVKSQLQQLVEKYPDGIWCADLPDVYLNEYKVPLKYTDLGFSSVREYVSYLPTIFHIEQKLPMDDFMVYSADKKPRNDTLFDDCRNMNDDEPVPAILSPMISEKFAPDGVMSCNESVGYIPVADLESIIKLYHEVHVVQVFTPSFFWIQLRENQKQFSTFLSDLNQFYEARSQEFIIPNATLQEGLNCACMYDGVWHRGIIKSLKPDLQVTIMFYDYGTLKTYDSHDIYYLHKAFSHLPAQAIACGLYNIRPYVGDRWRWSEADRFITKVSTTHPLVAIVVSIHTSDNTMMITLTDTSEEYDVRINDWLVQENLARHGEMINAVDMSGLMNYVADSHNRLPPYCYAEENLIPDNHVVNHNKATSTDDISLISPKHNVSCRPQQSVQSSSEFPTANCSNLKSILKIDPFKMETNPFLLAQSINVNELEKDAFMRIWQKNIEIQIEMMRLFLTFLNKAPVSKVLYETFLAAGHQFNETFHFYQELLLTNLKNPLVSMFDNRNQKEMSNNICEGFMNAPGTSFTGQHFSSTSKTISLKKMRLQRENANLREQKETNPFRLSAMDEMETRVVRSERTPLSHNTKEETQHTADENDRKRYDTQERAESMTNGYDDDSTSNNDRNTEDKSEKLRKKEINNQRNMLKKTASSINNIRSKRKNIDELALSLSRRQNLSTTVNHQSRVNNGCLNLNKSKNERKAHRANCIISNNTDPCVSNVQQGTNCPCTNLNNSNIEKCSDGEKRMVPTFTDDMVDSYTPHISSSDNIFSFRHIHNVKGITCIFHIGGLGWILTQEFIKTFTVFHSPTHLKMALQKANIRVNFMDIKRSRYPMEFLHLDSYPIEDNRNSQNYITHVDLIQLGNATSILCKSNLLTSEGRDAFDKDTFLEVSRYRMVSDLIAAYTEFKLNIINKTK